MISHSVNRIQYKSGEDIGIPIVHLIIATYILFYCGMSFFKSQAWYLLRNMCFVSGSMFMGDIICQKILHPEKSW